MSQKRIVVSFLLFWTMAAGCLAQIYASPYSRYGYGDLQSFTVGKAVSMGGLAYGMRDGSTITPANPASSTAIGQKTFMMDLGVSGMVDCFTTSDAYSSQFIGNIDYVAFQFPLAKFAAVSFGVLPYSTVGYDYSASAQYPSYAAADSTITATQSFSGSGGFTEVYLGFSFDIFDRVAVGVQGKYMFGRINRQRDVSFPGESVYYSSTSQTATMNVSSFLCDFGLQYHQPIGNDELVIGAAYSLALPLNIWSTTTTVTTATKTESSNAGFDYPHTVGAGFTYRIGQRWLFGADYQWQDFADARYAGRTDSLLTRHKIAAGVEYVHDATSKKYIEAMRFRLGMNYANSYAKVNAHSYSEWAITAGVGFPMLSSRSTINLHLEYGHRGSIAGTGLLEQYFKFGVSVSLAETWFVKRKFN